MSVALEPLRQVNVPWDASAVAVGNTLLASSANLNGVVTDSGGASASLTVAIDTRAAFKVTVPCRTIVNCDQGERPLFAALMADGNSLPDWLSFDPYTATFTGDAPTQTRSVSVLVSTVGAAGSSGGSGSSSWTSVELDFKEARVKR